MALARSAISFHIAGHEQKVQKRVRTALDALGAPVTILEAQLARTAADTTAAVGF